MNDAAFDNALDALARGQRPEKADDLSAFAAELYREQRNLTMPVAVKHQIAARLGLESLAPVSNRSRRARAIPPQQGRPRWSAAITVSLALLLAMTGIFQFGSGPNNEDDRFGMLSPAVPTADATPAANETDANAWLYPVDVHECPMEETVEIDLQSTSSVTWYSMEDYVAESPPTVYEPISRADPNEAHAVMQRLRQGDACSQAEDRMLPKFWTPRYEYETRTSEGREALAADQPRRLEAGQAISQWYEEELHLTPEDLVIMQDPAALGIEEPSSRIVYALYNPDHAIEVGDGRIGMISSQVMYRDPADGEMWGITYFPQLELFVFVDGEWRLDETLPMCIGECDDYWRSQPGASQPANSIVGCQVSDQFLPDGVVEAEVPVILRPGPSVGSGDPITVLGSGTELMSLCLMAPSADLQTDRLNVGDTWIKVRTELGEEGWVRTELGEEGWVRAIDVNLIFETSTPSPSSTPSG